MLKQSKHLCELSEREEILRGEVSIKGEKLRLAGEMLQVLQEQGQAAIVERLQSEHTAQLDRLTREKEEHATQEEREHGVEMVWQPVDSQRILLWAARFGKQEEIADAVADLVKAHVAAGHDASTFTAATATEVATHGLSTQ